MKVTVLAVGRLRPPFSDDVQHYQKLLARYVRLEMIEVREDEDVVRRVPERAYKVLLDLEGNCRDSVELSRWMEERRQSRRDLCFVVGGPYGTELSDVDEKISFGPLTLPHQLARVVLLEQIYRAHKIIAGEPYHH